ncbi:venom serine protease-like [Uranotaenia lowii]|uniref:venom serine protease-like n=1 Tax=Uranotaenia lowii TaxID=190385 RepID=UPI0024799251|nr:venom serine protease-like [Uranotaenia lowii]
MFKVLAQASFWLALFWLTEISNGQSYTGCDFSMIYFPGSVNYIASPNWPNYFKPGINCRYTLQAPVNYYLYAQCYNVELLNRTGCIYDKLILSLNGDPSLSGALWQCRNTPFNVASTGNKMVVALHSWPFTLTGGGRFRCQISVLPLPCNCGTRKKPLIVGGVSTQQNEFPMAAAIMNVATSKPNLVCGATIITDRHALTAAHCLAGRQVSSTALLVGGHNIANLSLTATSVLMNVSTFTRYPDYDATRQINDIALVRTTNAIVFNSAVGRACLPYPYTGRTFDGLNLETLGWGTLDYGGPMATVLQKVSLQVMNPYTCRSKLTKNTILGSQICTYTPKKDSCQYDSGGPMLYTSSTTGKVYSIGVINYGTACATDFPSVSSRVTSFIGWIEANTVGFNYCEKP